MKYFLKKKSSTSTIEIKEKFQKKKNLSDIEVMKLFWFNCLKKRFDLISNLI